MKKNKEFDDWLARQEIYIDTGILQHETACSNHEADLWAVYENIPTEVMYGLYLRFMREERGVLAYAYRNASGYLWAIEKSDGGTNLGWSDFDGDCEMSGAFTTYDKALEDIISLELEYGNLLHKKTYSRIKHWSNYAGHLKDRRKKLS